MANMNETQQSLLDQLSVVAVEYDNFEEALRKEVAERKWQERARTRELVRQARDIGVPWKKLGEALNTSDHRTVKAYANDERSTA